jgi:lipoate-protein ligase A
VSWAIEHGVGSASALHAASAHAVASEELHRRVRVLAADRPAVVLGSSQPERVVDTAAAAAAGVGVARRRSGGSAVLVGPGQVLWVDLILPRGDPLWSDDVGAATWWVGDLWAKALVSAEVLADPAALRVWRGGFVATAWSPLVCFAGVGPGEVVLDEPGRPGVKLVGVAQRRTRAGALFQCALLLRWQPEELLAVLALDPDRRAAGAAALADAGQGIGEAGAGRVLDALVSCLP